MSGPAPSRLASGSTDCTVRIWSIAEAKCEMILKGHTEVTRSATMPHAQQRCHTNLRQSVMIHFCDCRKAVFHLVPHGIDGQYGRIVSGSYDRTVRVTHELQMTLRRSDAARATGLEHSWRRRALRACARASSDCDGCSEAARRDLVSHSSSCRSTCSSLGHLHRCGYPPQHFSSLLCTTTQKYFTRSSPVMFKHLVAFLSSGCAPVQVSVYTSWKGTPTLWHAWPAYTMHGWPRVLATSQ